MFWELLETSYVIIIFQVWFSKSNTEKTMSDLYFDEQNTRKYIFWAKCKWQWRLLLHHSLTISVWVWTEKYMC